MPLILCSYCDYSTDFEMNWDYVRLHELKRHKKEVMEDYHWNEDEYQEELHSLEKEC